MSAVLSSRRSSFVLPTLAGAPHTPDPGPVRHSCTWVGREGKGWYLQVGRAHLLVGRECLLVDMGRSKEAGRPSGQWLSLCHS